MVLQKQRILIHLRLRRQKILLCKRRKIEGGRRRKSQIDWLNKSSKGERKRNKKLKRQERLMRRKKLKSKKRRKRRKKSNRRSFLTMKSSKSAKKCAWSLNRKEKPS